LLPSICTLAPIAPLVGLRPTIVGEGKTVKVPALVATPPGAVTLIVPVLPAPTTALILVDDNMLKEAASVPPNFTEVAPVKLVPVITTVTLCAPLLGVNEEMVGAAIKVNPARLAVPPGVVTETLPEAPLATTAVIVVAFTTLKEVAAVPPKLTAVAPVKLVPVMVTVAPLAALVGVNDEMVGAGIKVNPARLAVPPGVVTDTLPEAPLATTAVIVVASTTLKEAADIPPKVTSVASVKLVPVMVTAAPLAALVGVNDEMVGAGI